MFVCMCISSNMMSKPTSRNCAFGSHCWSMVVTCCYPESSTGNLKSPMVLGGASMILRTHGTNCQLTF